MNNLSAYRRFIYNKEKDKPMILDTKDGGAVHFDSGVSPQTAIDIVSEYIKHNPTFSLDQKLPADLRSRLEKECGSFRTSYDCRLRLN